MVHLNPESIKQFENIRKGITQFCCASGSIRDGIRSYIDASLLGSEPLQTLGLDGLCYDICTFAAELTEDFGWRIPEKEYKAMVREKIAPLPPVLRWHYALFLEFVARKCLPRKFITEYLNGIDRTYHVNEWCWSWLKCYNPTWDYAEMAEEVIEALFCTPMAAAVLMYGSDSLAKGDPIVAMQDVVAHLESDVLQLAQLHAIEIASLFTAAALGRLDGVPSLLTMEGLKFFYLADDQPSNLYTTEYLQHMDEYEIAPHRFRQGSGDGILGFFRPLTNEGVLLRRLKSIKWDYRARAIALPKIEPGTVLFVKQPGRYSTLPEATLSRILTLASTHPT